MRVWSGGVPLSFHLQRAKKHVELIFSKTLPLGVLDDNAFDVPMVSIFADKGDSLLLMTDGIPESVNTEGVMFRLDSVEELVKTHCGDSFEELHRQYADFAGVLPQEDHVPLAEVVAKPLSKAKETISASKVIIPWTTTVQFDPKAMRELEEPVGDVLRLLPESLAFSVYYERIATVVTELYSNALEHGVLGLDSKLKRGAEVLATYCAMREDGLAKLLNARVEIRLF